MAARHNPFARVAQAGFPTEIEDLGRRAAVKERPDLMLPTCHVVIGYDVKPVRSDLRCGEEAPRNAEPVKARPVQVATPRPIPGGVNEDYRGAVVAERGIVPVIGKAGNGAACHIPDENVTEAVAEDGLPV